MTATEYYQTQITDFKVIGNTAEAPMHAIPGEEILQQVADAPADLKTKADIFNITFNYKGQRHQTKVLKVGTHKHETFYKVALNSHLCATHNMCWLQRQDEGWITLLGLQTPSGLISAITEAIEQSL